MAVRAGMVVALVVLVAGVAPASAEVTSVGGFKYVSKSFDVPAQKAKRLKAMCPDSTHAYGGGQSNTTLYGGFAQLQSYPVDDGDPGKTPDDGWGLLVKNLTGSSVDNVVAFAACGAPAAEYRRKQVPMFPNTYTGETDMRCKSRQLVGGGMFGPGRAVLLDGGADDFPEGPTYYTYLHNTSQVKNATATQYAVCAGVDTSYVLDQKQIGAAMRDQSTVACPTKTAVLSGGLYSTGGVTLTASFPPATFREWTIVGDNTLASQQTIGALAVCGAHP